MVAGWLVVMPGAWLLLAGRLRWRRVKGRRCVRCDYDMAGISLLTCPECGRIAKGEKELMRRRPRAWLRLAGACVAMVGWLLTQGAAVVEHGWAAAVPGWALAWVAPVEVSEAMSFNGGYSIYPSLPPGSSAPEEWLSG